MARGRKPKTDSSIGHYILGKTIGEGTFGKVKLGTHLPTGEQVAVKILERHRIKEVADVQRVAREIHILKKVHHPHIIKLFEIIETEFELTLIMEYCNGGELFDHIVECGRVHESDACNLFRQIISAVEQVHKMNVVHRDLKPENLLLDMHKNIKLVDFGLSNVFAEGQLLSTACGSPCYAAPEMIAGQPYVPENCDVWSCGVILFALVCGHLPFEDQNTAALYRQIMKAEFQTPRFISPEVRELIHAIFTVDPEKRITIPGIRQHPWYLKYPQVASACETRALDEEIQEDVLEELVSLGFSRSNARKSLKEREHNHVTASYYLLLEKKRRLIMGPPPRSASETPEQQSQTKTGSHQTGQATTSPSRTLASKGSDSQTRPAGSRRRKGRAASPKMRWVPKQTAPSTQE